MNECLAIILERTSKTERDLPQNNRSSPALAWLSAHICRGASSPSHQPPGTYTPMIAEQTVCCTGRGLTFLFNSHPASSKCQNVTFSYPPAVRTVSLTEQDGVCESVMEEAAESFLIQPDEEQEECRHERPPGGSVKPFLSLFMTFFFCCCFSHSYKWEKGLSCSSWTSNDILSSNKSYNKKLKKNLKSVSRNYTLIS